MILRLFAVQVVAYWDVLKYALQKTDYAGRETFNTVFTKLLTDRAQAWILHNGERLTGAIITEIIDHRLTGQSRLNIRMIYAYEQNEDEVWEQAYEMIKKFGNKKGCNLMYLSFAHPKILETAQGFGFEERFKTLEYDLGD